MKITDKTRVNISHGVYWSGTLGECKSKPGFIGIGPAGIAALESCGEYDLGIFGVMRVDKSRQPATYCPYCGGSNIVEIDSVTVFNKDDKEHEYPWLMDEYQCRDCENRTFIA